MTHNGVQLKGMTYNEATVKKWYHNGVNVWNKGAEVSYYDGDRLIGKLDVDEGLDVLHPALELSKEGYTLCGWALEDGSLDAIQSMVAGTDPITLYGIYLPNTYNVYVEGSFRDERFTSGSYRAATSATSSSKNDTSHFNVNFGFYKNGAINCYFNMSGGGFGAYYVNGVQNIVYSGTTYIANIDKAINNGDNTIGVDAYANGGSTLGDSITIRRITLSSPVAWT